LKERILIVDDNPDMLSFVSTCMKEDYEVLTATDGASALDLLQRDQVDLIISDVMMPGIDGFELCRRVKSDIRLSHIPIILLTARTTDVSRIEGLQLGADDYLTKPFNIEVLRLRVKKFIEWEQNNHRQFRQKMDIEPSQITITPLDEQFIKKAIALVEENIADSDFSVETLAAAVAMSRSTLYKKLMAITGQGPAEFIRTIRIKRGRALLETSQMQITEIAYAVGFTTVKSFTMNFKAEYGMTPSEFMKTGTAKAE
jgi:DNA-binding response OmpR family regulator